MKKILILVCVLLVSVSMTAFAKKQKPVVPKEPLPVVLGIERLAEPEVSAVFANKRVGIFTNQTGVDSKLNSSVDLLRAACNLQAIFVPEHGLFGAVSAGEKFADSTYDGITVFSLYGENRRPTKAMLDTVDVIAVDIQDVGVRHYTYVSSLAYIMEECAKYGKQVVVFDRPNPLGGKMEGPVLKPQYKTFIGLYEIPLRHGLTIGEFANYINTEEKINCDLTIVRLLNWTRDMLWADTKLPWVQTSPNIPTAESALLYSVTGVCGDSGIDIGVGTTKPFHFAGNTYMDAGTVKKALDALQIPGVGFRRTVYAKKDGSLVHGVEIYLLNPKIVNLPELEYQIIYTMQTLYPEQMDAENLPKRYNNVEYKADICLGEDSVEKHLAPAEIFPRWQAECAAFAQKATPYLLYEAGLGMELASAKKRSSK